jgi:hypothetical protein
VVAQRVRSKDRAAWSDRADPLAAPDDHVSPVVVGWATPDDHVFPGSRRLGHPDPIDSGENVIDMTAGDGTAGHRRRRRSRG